MRRRRIATTFVAAAALLLAGGALAHPHEDAMEATDEALDRAGEPTTVLHGESEADGRSRRVIVLRQHRDASEVQVSVDGRAHSGEMSWRLEDPDGKEVFQVWADDGALRGGSGRISCAGRRCEGDWLLEMETRGDVTWTLRAWGMTIVPAPERRSQSR